MSFGQVGYQALAIGPDVRDFSPVLCDLQSAIEFIKLKGPYMDALWVIVGPSGISDHSGFIAKARTARMVKETLMDLYDHGDSSLAAGFPLCYVYDRSPLPKEQHGGYSAVVVQWKGGKPALIYEYWCISKLDAVRNLETLRELDRDQGPWFKAIVYGPEDIYDGLGNVATRELYESVKGIRCHDW